MSFEWKTIDKDTFEIKSGGLDIIVSRFHTASRDWLVICRPQILGGENVISGCGTSEEAKREALKLVRGKLANLSRAADELPAEEA